MKYRTIAVTYIAISVLTAACGKSAASPTGPRIEGWKPLTVSNPLFRPGAIVADDSRLGGERLSPEIVCTAEWSIGPEEGADKAHDDPTNDLEQSTAATFQAKAEAKILDVVKARAHTRSDFKLRSTLQNARILQPMWVDSRFEPW